MKALVVYYSRGGNTRKIAEAMAQELGCIAVDVMKETPDVSGLDLLIIGSGNYGDKVGDKLQQSLSDMPQIRGGKAAVFATAGGPDPKSLAVMQETLEKKGYEVLSSFKSRGQFLYFLNHGRPNSDDLTNASNFAGDLKKKIG
jgi:flavodoxin